MISALLALGLSNAHAAPSKGSLLIGVGALPGADEPATVRVAARFEVPVISGEAAGLGVLFPVELASAGESGFGFSTRQTALELAPSIRGRLFETSVVRPYADIGFGVVNRFSQTSTWFGDASRSRLTAMTRSAIGLEIGGVEPGTAALVLEPFGWRRYGLDGDGADRLTFLAGVQAAF